MGCVCSSKRAPSNPDSIDLSHFDLLKVVGKGGFGKVNAIQLLYPPHTLYALKRMSKYDVLQRASHVELVWRERRIMSIFNPHDTPFLVNLIYAFESPKELFLVLPFCAGGDLRYCLNQVGRMSEEMAVFYAAQLALALESMHKRMIVYRDLKRQFDQLNRQTE